MARNKRSVRFRKVDSLALIVDKVPRSDELPVGTEVVALYHDTIKRYYTGTITWRSPSNNMYLVNYDDGDVKNVKINDLRLPTAPRFCKR